ncbi:MAG: sugar ABC transporter permease [Actinomycetota bacterium]|nr:sugar ABC transporter permease [Actinomycetota bacterium]
MIASKTRRPRSARSRVDRRRRGVGLLLATPLMTVVALLVVVPLLEAGYYSMTSWNGISVHWIGLQSYAQLFLHTFGIGQILQNNAAVVVSIPVGLVLALVAAFFTATQAAGSRLFRSLVFLPVALSWVVVGIVFSDFLATSGGLDTLLRTVGLGFMAQDWLGNTHTAMLALLATFTWGMFGINTVIFMTGLAAIPTELVDAARVDGASTPQTLRYVILPVMRRFLQLAFIVTMISGFSGLFALIFVMTAGGPGFATTTLEFEIYQEAFALGNFGAAAAFGIVLFAIMVVLTLTVGRLGGREQGAA